MRQRALSIATIFSEGFAVFVGGGVFEDAEVAGVARSSNEAVIEGLPNSTPGFVSVGAITEATILGYFENFGEEVADFNRIEVDGTKAFYSRGINDGTGAVGKVKHLRESGCVHTGIVG